jgi:UDPglucose--hexose-1-phosphate uridylyltransferase
MPELRVDPLTGDKTIVASQRAGRPGGVPAVSPPPPLDPEGDPFAEGHEQRTPPELYAVRPDGSAPDTPGWLTRVVPNRYPAVEPDGADPPPRAQPDLFTARAAAGAHEVIINAPRPVTTLAELSGEEMARAVETWRARMRAHADAACRHLIVNERAEAGASLPHTHAQLYALDFVPARAARERERFGAYAVRMMGANLLADLVQAEVRERERIVAIDDEAVLMAPYGARLPYQLLLAPRRSRARFEDDGPSGAAMLREAVARLGALLGAPPPLNLWVRTEPRGAEQYCWRIDIVPRLTHLAGLEMGIGVHLNIVAPERAAAELRACAR